MNFLTPYLLYIRIGLVAAVIAGIGLVGWRVHSWRADAQQLATCRQNLDAETTCAAGSACASRAATVALEAAKAAQEAADDAVQAALEAERKARADAAAWRAKYQAALRTDPECKSWSDQPVRCPL